MSFSVCTINKNSLFILHHRKICYTGIGTRLRHWDAFIECHIVSDELPSNVLKDLKGVWSGLVWSGRPYLLSSHVSLLA